MVTMHTGVDQYNMPSKGSGSEWDMLELAKKNKFGWACSGPKNVF